MHLHSALETRKGIARASALKQLGVKRAELERGIASGTLVRPKRGWIALRSADPALIEAAASATIVTCVTQAKRLGLWVLEDPTCHMALRTPKSHTPTAGRRLHWGAPLALREPWALEDSLENTLQYVAECQPREAAIAVWESALNKRLITLDRLASMPLSRTSRVIAEACTPFSDSGLETIVRLRLRWLPVTLTAQAWVHGRRVDFLIGRRLVLQIDGGDHVGAQRTSDNMHDAELKLSGYHVIRVSYVQVMHDWPATQRLIMTAISQGLHL